MRPTPSPLRAAVACAALLLAWISRPSAPPASADEAVFKVPAGIPVSLDGNVLPGEWDDAATCPMDAPGVVLRAKQSRATLLLALTTDRPWPARGRLLLFARAGDGGLRDEGTVSLDYEPTEHDRPHAIVRVMRNSLETPADDQVVIRMERPPTSASLEAAIPLALLGITGPKSPPLRWMIGVVRPGATPKTVTFPSELDIGAVLGAPPVDLATTAHWARTDSFPGAGGPGAFPKSEWDAWVGMDRYLAKRGAAAHGLAGALRGDGGEGAPVERPKHDATIETDLLGNLRWIAGREPLTANDVRAMAVGLWGENRTPEALAALEASAATRWGGDADDLQLRARFAADAERYEDAALAWEMLAGRVTSGQAPSYQHLAKSMRDLLPAWLAEQKARKDDDLKDDLPLVLLRTSKGNVVLRLLEDDVPDAVANFVQLVEAAKADDGKPFYAGTLFHRVIANGLVQGGDPDSRTKGCEGAGAGGCSWWIAPEKNPRHAFFRGSVGFAMADGKVRSQFFLLTGPRPKFSDSGFACFATVAAGMDAVDRLDACDTLISASVLRKRPHAYEPHKKPN